MVELAKRFIGKDCYITMIEGVADGTLKEVTDGGLVLENKGKQQIINLEFVVKIVEYPHNKKGKRAIIVAD